MSTQFPVHTPETAPASAREAMAAVKKKFGFIPNLIGVMAESPAALQGYLSVSEAFAQSSFSPAEQQLVLLATAVQNHCSYCVAAHSMLFEKAGGDSAALEALREGNSIDDPRLEALRRFTLQVVEKRGWVDEKAIQAFLDAGFTRPQVFEVVLGVAQKTLSNYINHIAGTPVDAPFSGHAWQAQQASASGD